MGIQSTYLASVKVSTPLVFDPKFVAQTWDVVVLSTPTISLHLLLPRSNSLGS